MSQDNITFRLESNKRAELDAIAAGLDRNYVLNEAITAYLEIHQWQLGEIQKGITEAESEDFANEAEVDAMFSTLTYVG
jgi:RHH-type transcriptional regulator, rel operon repressor / antitoxin RelB